MSLWENNLSPMLTQCSNPSPGRHRESPDLLTRWMGEKLVDVGIGASERMCDRDSQGNHTDIIISDDSTPSRDSDATVILDPDIIIDYEKKRESKTSSFIPVAGCSTPKKPQSTQENVGMIRCKPLKDLLSENNGSSPQTEYRIPENHLDSPKRSGTRSSDSSSSSLIPPTPKRLRTRRRIVIASDSEDSDTALINVVKKSTNRKTEQQIFQANPRSRSSGKLSSYLPMKEWSMHETTPPTSGSNESDDDSETQRKQRWLEKSHSRNHRLFDSTESSGRTKFMPKYILDENYRVKKSIDTQTNESSRKRYTITFTKGNIGDKIKQSSNIRKSMDNPSISNVGCPRVELVPLKLTKVVIEDRKYVTKPNETRKNDNSNNRNGVSVNDKLMKRKSQRVCIRDAHRRWMQRHPDIESKIRKDRDIPVGSTFCEWERLGMVWWLLKTDRIHEARLKATWGQMQTDGYLKHRTIRSLQNHFIRRILPDLREFSLSPEIIEEFKTIMS